LCYNILGVFTEKVEATDGCFKIYGN
jgi:hypothetical protein